MILHYAAAGLLVLIAILHAKSGGFKRSLQGGAQIDNTGQLQKHDPNAILAVVLVALLLAGAVIVLIVPGIPGELEIGLGMLVIFSTVAALVSRPSISLRPILWLVTGVLILAGNFL